MALFFLPCGKELPGPTHGGGGRGQKCFIYVYIFFFLSSELSTRRFLPISRSRLCYYSGAGGLGEVRLNCLGMWAEKCGKVPVVSMGIVMCKGTCICVCKRR